MKFALLRDVCFFNPPKSEVRENLEADALVSFMPMQDLGIESINAEAGSSKPLSEVVKAYTYFAENDILIAKITPCFENGKMGIARNLVNGVGFGSSEYFVLRPADNVLSEYIYYFLRQDFVIENGRGIMTGAVGHRRVPADYLENLQIPLPTIEKQREIIEKLQSAFTELDLLQENFLNLRNKYDELLQSFQFNSYQRSETRVKIGAVCKLMTGGTPSRTRDDFFRNGTVKWLVSGDIHQGEIFDCEGRITTEAMRSSNTKILPINSVMIALNGQGKTRGTVALLKTEATCNQSLVSISPINIEELMPEFLFYNLKMRYQELRRMTGDDGNDRRGLNMALIREIEIPLPPLANQIEIVKNLKLVDESFQELKTQIELKEAKVKDLRKSLLSKSFSDTRELLDVTY